MASCRGIAKLGPEYFWGKNLISLITFSFFVSIDFQCINKVKKKKFKNNGAEIRLSYLTTK